MRRFAHVFFITLMVSFAGAFSATAVQAEIDYAKNLAQVPPTDPGATAPPTMVEAMQGVHPRLLFTAGEIESIKGRRATDPIIDLACESVLKNIKRMRLPIGDRPAIVTGDGAALTQSVGQLPTLVYAYGLQRDPAIKDKLVELLELMLAQEHWAHSLELDSNMGAGNNMLMVGLAFDAVHDELDPEFRLTMARKMLTHVRRMYWLGHRQRSTCPIKYWQQDPQNNHRWHRAAGMAACLLAIADVEGIDCDFQLEQFRKEMDFLVEWFPADGDSHEGPGYQTFGFFYLAVAAKMCDRAWGTEYLKHPGFANAWAQQVYYWTPGRQGAMGFGDSANLIRPVNHLGAGFFVCPALSRDANVQAMMANFFETMSKRKDGRPHTYPWTVLACYDPTVPVGDYKAIPTYRLFADLGAATMRDSWEDDAVLFTFKCGPYGGYRLNEYRHTNLDAEGKPHYVNIAHDDPDANSFALGTAGEFLFHPGNYASVKTTDNHNTVVVDGVGQIGEGDQYSQPTAEIDMRTLSYLTGWKADAAGRVIVEGEAGPAYETLKRFRRTAVWMPGEYILLLDDIVADGEREITWLGASPKAQFDNAERGKCHAYTDNGQRVDFQVLASRPFSGSVDHMFMRGRWTGLMMHQFQFGAKTDAIKFVCLMDPWKRGVEMEMRIWRDEMTIFVRGDGFKDAWTLKRGKDMTSPSSLVGLRDGKPIIELTSADKAPQGDEH